jgi:AcrR family transcriptional regulator
MKSDGAKSDAVNSDGVKSDRRDREVVRRTPAPVAAGASRPAQRMPRAEREREIVQHAVRFFAEVGFGGDTRELAKRAHVTHALLFRYFPSKDSLIERVYQEVYLGRWNPDWERLIKDRSVPLRERMVRFYKLYAQTILSYEWVRLIMFAGLKGADLNRRFFALVTERIVAPICREIRLEHGLSDVAATPLTQVEVELVWGVNSRIFYFGVRKYVYGMPVPENLDVLIEAEVRTFFDGIGATLADLLEGKRSGATTAVRRTRGGAGKSPRPRAGKSPRPRARKSPRPRA